MTGSIEGAFKVDR